MDKLIELERALKSTIDEKAKEILLAEITKYKNWLYKGSGVFGNEI